jgi:hypothetical protein
MSGEMHFVAHGPSIGKVMDPRMAGIQNKANCRTGAFVVCPQGHALSLPKGHQEKRLAASLRAREAGVRNKANRREFQV